MDSIDRHRPYGFCIFGGPISSGGKNTYRPHLASPLFANRPDGPTHPLVLIICSNRCFGEHNRQRPQLYPSRLGWMSSGLKIFFKCCHFNSQNSFLYVLHHIFELLKHQLCRHAVIFSQYFNSLSCRFLCFFNLL